MALETDFVVVPYDRTIWDDAKEKAKNLPVFRGSHRGEMANEVGCLGECVIQAWFAAEQINLLDERSNTTHDFRAPNGETIEVKTKDRTVVPKLGYAASAAAYNREHQRPDRYVFASLLRAGGGEGLRRWRAAYIVGGLSGKAFDGLAVCMGKGTTDPANGTTFWTDSLNVQIRQLDAPAMLIGQMQKSMATQRVRAALPPGWWIEAERGGAVRCRVEGQVVYVVESRAEAESLTLSPGAEIRLVLDLDEIHASRELWQTAGAAERRRWLEDLRTVRSVLGGRVQSVVRRVDQKEKT